MINDFLLCCVEIKKKSNNKSLNVILWGRIHQSLRAGFARCTAEHDSRRIAGMSAAPGNCLLPRDMRTARLPGRSTQFLADKGRSHTCTQKTIK